MHRRKLECIFPISTTRYSPQQLLPSQTQNFHITCAYISARATSYRAWRARNNMACVRMRVTRKPSPHTQTAKPAALVLIQILCACVVPLVVNKCDCLQLLPDYWRRTWKVRWGFRVELSTVEETRCVKSKTEFFQGGWTFNKASGNYLRRCIKHPSTLFFLSVSFSASKMNFWVTISL